MTYQVVLTRTDEGVSINCPALPGCWSQGSTREEALANIREAIALWLDVQEEDIRHDVEAEGIHFSREVVTI